MAAALALAGLAACGSSSDSSKGRVYFLNSKPEVSKEWKAIAQEYTKETGVEVIVQTAASGTYDQTLKSEMPKSKPPTLFATLGPVSLNEWHDYASDMSKTKIYQQMQNKNIALKDSQGVVRGIPWVMETYGLIYNKNLLNKYFKLSDAAVTSADQINSFAKLKAVADGIQKHKAELGVQGAFASSGFDSSSSWRFNTHLANIPLYYEMKKRNLTDQPKSIKGTYMKGFKNIFDLYITDATVPRTTLSSKTADDATSEFATGKAVFYQNGTWAWTDLKKAGFKPDDIGMLPIYIGAKGEEKQGLTTGSENYWTINSNASKADQKATADFLYWMITSEKGKKCISKDMDLVTPFKSMANIKSENPLVNIAKADATSGKTDVTWNFTLIPSETWKTNLANALLEYAQGTSNWAKVENAYVKGWATEYAASHSQN